MLLFHLGASLDASSLARIDFRSRSASMAVQFAEPKSFEDSGSRQTLRRRLSRCGQLPAGEELDRYIESRVFGRAAARSVPPFSTEEWTATALAELVSRETGWRFEAALRDGTWEAMWIEYPRTGRRRVLSLTTATAPTRALAICRALIKATGSPRWPAMADGGPMPDADCVGRFGPALRAASSRARSRS
jgi:hypothetical protein